MTNDINDIPEENQPEKKKVSLQEVLKQKLASNKKEQAAQQNKGNFGSNKQMRSQQSKKTSNPHRRTGGE